METNKAEWTKLFDEYENQLENGNDLSYVVERYLPKFTPTKGQSPMEKRKSRRQTSGPVTELTRRKSKQQPNAVNSNLVVRSQ